MKRFRPPICIIHSTHLFAHACPPEGEVSTGAPSRSARANKLGRSSNSVARLNCRSGAFRCTAKNWQAVTLANAPLAPHECGGRRPHNGRPSVVRVPSSTSRLKVAHWSRPPDHCHAVTGHSVYPTPRYLVWRFGEMVCRRAGRPTLIGAIVGNRQVMRRVTGTHHFNLQQGMGTCGKMHGRLSSEGASVGQKGLDRAWVDPRHPLRPPVRPEPSAIGSGLLGVPTTREARIHTPQEWALLDQVVDGSPIGVVVLDGDLRFVRVSSRAEAMFGVTERENCRPQVGECLTGDVRRDQGDSHRHHSGRPCARCDRDVGPEDRIADSTATIPRVYSPLSPRPRSSALDACSGTSPTSARLNRPPR